MTDAFAQDAGTLLREQERRQQAPKLERQPAPAIEEHQQQGPETPETGPVIEVKDLRFTGKVSLLTQAERAAFVGKVKGLRLGMAGLGKLTAEITEALQRKGALLARAVMPPQDVTGGVVTIDIVEGRLEKTEFERGKGVRIHESLLDGFIKRDVDAGAPTKAELETALLGMNALPGVTVRSRLVPGGAPDASRLIVGVQEAPLVSATLGGDNAGTPSTGSGEGSATLALTDLTGLGDQTRLSTVDSQGQKFGQVDFSVPIGSTGLAGTASYGYLDYRNLTALGRSADLRGHAQFASAGLAYSLLRSRNLDLRLSGVANWNALVDDSVAGQLDDKRVGSGTFSVSADMRDALLGGGASALNLAWTTGDLDLSRNASSMAADASGLRTQGNFQRVNASATRIQALPSGFSLLSRFSGQWSDKNLDTSESFVLGGPYGVRAYPVGEARGDMGWLGTLELRYDVPLTSRIGQVQLVSFVDGGRVWVNKHPDGVPPANACGCNAYDLYGAGLGVRWTRKDLSLSVTWARALGDNPGRALDGTNSDGGRARQQLWLQGVIQF